MYKIRKIKLVKVDVRHVCVMYLLALRSFTILALVARCHCLLQKQTKLIVRFPKCTSRWIHIMYLYVYSRQICALRHTKLSVCHIYVAHENSHIFIIYKSHSTRRFVYLWIDCDFNIEAKCLAGGKSSAKHNQASQCSNNAPSTYNAIMYCYCDSLTTVCTRPLTKLSKY